MFLQLTRLDVCVSYVPPADEAARQKREIKKKEAKKDRKRPKKKEKVEKKEDEPKEEEPQPEVTVSDDIMTFTPVLRHQGPPNVRCLYRSSTCVNATSVILSLRLNSSRSRL